MNRDLRFWPETRRHSPATRTGAPPIRFHVRPRLMARRDHDDLRTARGLFAGVLLGAGIWTVLLLMLYWLSAD